MKTIAVVGGTGMLGAPVAKQFSKDGYQVRVLSRDPSRASGMFGQNIELVQGDPHDRVSLAAALQGVDAVHINLGGHSQQTYYQNHVLATENILQVLGSAPPKLISMISSASAYPEYADRWDNRYKYQAEQLLQESGLDYLVFKPTWFMESLSLFEQKQRLIRIGPSKQAIHWLAANDYAKVVSASYQDPLCRNKVVSVFGPEAITMAEACKQFAERRGLKLSYMPAWLASLVGRLSKDEVLVDVADLMVHTEKTGEKWSGEIIRTNQTLAQWSAAHS